jgi:hypothetical protein
MEEVYWRRAITALERIEGSTPQWFWVRCDNVNEACNWNRSSCVECSYPNVYRFMLVINNGH